MNRAREWLSTCRTHHHACSLSGTIKAQHVDTLNRIPIRLIRIIQSNPVLVTIPVNESPPHYVALSHCWGPSPPLKTLKRNITDYESQIPISLIPGTFRDAIHVARSLDFDYIWIDSLCIIQDSREDWERQSSQMANIYSMAELVLGAVCASSAHDGFLKPRFPHRESTLKVQSVKESGKEFPIRYRLLPFPDSPLLVEHLYTRAWAFQERQLARRFLAYGLWDMMWACVESSCCECGGRGSQSPSDQGWGVPHFSEALEDSKARGHEPRVGAGTLWEQMVLTPYFGRQLTIPHDNLVAVSALASRFQAASGWTYLAGLWRENVIRGLLWQPSGRFDRPRLGPVQLDHVALKGRPSWTWASLSTLDIGPYTHQPDENELVEVLETKAVPSTVDPFGAVSEGLIKLSGILWRASADSDATKGLQIYVHHSERFTSENFKYGTSIDTLTLLSSVVVKDGRTEVSVRRATEEDMPLPPGAGKISGSFFAIPVLMQNERRDGYGLVSGILAGWSSSVPSGLERLGVFGQLIPSNMGVEDVLEGFEKQTICLV